jgi:hypothetical protein
MNHINTIRETIELATPHFQADTVRFQKALTALDALEADRAVLREALKNVSLFLHHCCVDVHMNDYSSNLLEVQIKAVDAALENNP